MRFAWFILIYCFLVKANADNKTSIIDLTNRTDSIDKKSIDLNTTELNKQNSTINKSIEQQSSFKKQIKINKDDILSALPSTASLTTLPIRADVVHKSIPIQRGIIKSRPLAGVKSSNYQFSRQVKDIKQPLEELQTERSTVIASTRPAPLSTIENNNRENLADNQRNLYSTLNQLENKSTTPSIPNLGTTKLDTETSDQLVRRSSLSKTNLKSGKTNEHRNGLGIKGPVNFNKNFFGKEDQYEHQQEKDQRLEDPKYNTHNNQQQINDDQQARQLIPSDEQSSNNNRDICDFCLYEGEGNFTSYGYPLPYKNNLNCSYRVQRVDEFETCALEIYFHEFDIPIEPLSASPTVSGNKNSIVEETATNECKGDYLEIQGRRYCGNGWTGKMETIPFAPEQTELSFKFRSDQRGSGKGFWLEVRRKLGSCLGRIPPNKKCEKRYSEMKFTITNPQYPSTYSNNINCAYFIRKATPDVCGLEMRFKHFDVEFDNNCNYDFFEIDGEKLCGTIEQDTLKRIKFSPETDQKQFNFQSDKEVGRTGFNIDITQLTNCESLFDEHDELKLEQLPPPPSCSVCTSDKNGTLVSYGYSYGNYRNNLHCSYTIDRKNYQYCGIQLYFEDFNVAPSPNCEEDYLLIGEEKYCGTVLHSTRKSIPFRLNNGKDGTKSAIEHQKENSAMMMPSTNTSIQMIFHTNQVQTAKGFKIKFQQIKCNINSNDDETNSRIKIQSNIVPDMNDNDIARYSANRDHDRTNNLDSMSGYSPTTPMPPVHCEHHFNSKYFTLISPNTTSTDSGEVNANGHHVLAYPNNLACDFRITQNSSQVCYLELTFRKFDVEASAQCQFDYLEINNVRLCGTLQRQTTRTYIFNTMNKVVRFRTDGSTSRSGFIIDVEQLECNGDAIIRPNLPMLNNNNIDNNLENRKTNLNNKPQMMHNNLDNSGGLKKDNNQMMNNNTMNDLCAKMYTENEFEVFSPNYPLNYPLNSFCVYTVQRSSPSVCKFEINFMQFNIENSKAGICTADYLDIMGIKVCGTLGSNTKKQFPFPMDRNDVRIVFSANALRSENDLGFYLRFKQIHCNNNNEMMMNNQINNNPLPPYAQQEQPNDYPTNPLFLDSTLSGNCNEMHAENIFQLKSPNFPSNYVRNLNCVYKIIKNKPEICQLEVNVIEFNVQPAINSGQTMSIIQAQECGQEYVDFNGNQICGRISPRTVRFFPFTGSEFIIKFKSGYTDLDGSSSNNDRAFLLQVRQRECQYLLPNQQMPTDEQRNQIMMGNTKTGKTPLIISNNFEKKKQIEVCDQQFDTKEFEIKYAVQTPTKDGSMNTENRTHNCIYTIRRLPSVCALGFVFNEFLINDMGVDSNCDLDYFKVTDTEKLCSNLPFQMIKKIPFNEDNKVLQLHLSSSNPLSQKRVYIKVVQINCSTNENSITQNPNLNQQVIAQLPSMNPTLHSPSPINQSPSQQVPEMYNNNNNNQTMDSIDKSNINQIDYMHQLPPPSICELCYTELSGDIISYNYPAAYPRQLNCNYKITGQPGFCGVYLRFYVFTINNADTRTASTPCVDDYLELNSVKYCGKQLENVKKILAFDSNPKELSFRFVSKKHTIGNGFKLGYMQIPCYLTPGQESILTAMMTDTPISNGGNQAAASPKFSLPSSNSGGGQSKTSDSFSQENQVQENEMTNGDYQAFYSSADPNPITQQHQSPIPQSTKSLTLSSNSSLNSTKDSSSSSMSSSNDLSQASTIHNIPRLPCDQAIYDRFFEIHSPNYPFSYPSNSDCLYSVRRLSSSICKLRLYFADFELENDHNYKLIKDNHSLQRNLLHQTDEGCNEDFLEINEKLRFCGAQLNNTLRDFDFTSYKFPLRFKSNEEGSSKGFVIRGEQIQCVPNSIMFPDNKQSINQLQSSDSNLSTFKLNSNNNRIPGLDQIGFYTLPPVKHNSTSYSSSSSAVFRNPTQTSTTNSSTSSYQSSSTSQSQSLNSNDSLAFLSPNSNYQLTPLNQPQPSIKWNIPNSAPYMISIKGQQVSINGEHPNTYYFTNNDTQSTPKNAANFNLFNQKLSTSINNISSNNQILNDPQQPIASDSQTHHHTSSSTSQYNCNQIISDPVFELTSPYYPYRYDSNTRCLITIQKYKRNVCHLDLVFIKFDLGSSSDCDHYTDYLQINGERFCGHYYHNRSLHFSMPDDITRAVKVRTFRFDGPTLAMSFNGEIGTGYGFYLRGRQVECAVVGKDFVGRILPITDPHDHENLHPLVDNHPDHYHSNEHSHEDHSGEQNDHHLTPINPPPSHHHHLPPSEINHHHHHPPPPSEINHHHHPPHHLDKPAYHYHPDHYYRLLHKDNVTLDHSPKTNHTVRYNLDHKHLNQNTTTNNFNYPPHVDLHHQINNYQSNKNEHTNHTTNNLTKHHNLQNHYNTHNYHTNSQANHETKYNVSNYLIDSNKLVGVPRSLTALPHCDQIFSSNYIQIQSPNHPSNYPNNILCRYVIQRPNNQTCGIDLTFVNFSLEEEDRCSKDYFEIDGSRICGTLPPYHQRRYYYFSGESEKVLTFRTDLFISHSGFSILGQQITNCNSYSSRTDNSPIKCDVQTDSVKGELISRNYPSPYDHNMQCTYKIRAADQRFCRLTLRIRDFDIRSNANCDDDYLYNIVTLYFPENGVLRELQFNFYSNSIESGRGFYIEYLQELCIGNKEHKFQTGIGHSYPVDSKSTSNDQSNQARSMDNSMRQSDGNDSIQQTISLRQQIAKVGEKKTSPSYPSNNYIARSNPVGEMIEAIDRGQNDQMNNSKNHHYNNSSTISYPSSYSNQMSSTSKHSSPLFDGRKSQTNGRQLEDNYDNDRNRFNNDNDRFNSDNDRFNNENDNRNSKQMNHKSNSDDKWSGNVQLVKPTVAGNAVATFLNKLKMGDQVTTNIKGRYEVIDTKKVKK